MVPIQIMYIDVHMHGCVFSTNRKRTFLRMLDGVFTFILMVFSSLIGSVDVVQVSSCSSQHVFKGL
jgi:hypothetical protein